LASPACVCLNLLIGRKHDDSPRVAFVSATGGP
jgi:hypothetical protein